MRIWRYLWSDQSDIPVMIVLSGWAGNFCGGFLGLIWVADGRLPPNTNLDETQYMLMLGALSSIIATIIALYIAWLTSYFSNLQRGICRWGIASGGFVAGLSSFVIISVYGL